MNQALTAGAFAGLLERLGQTDEAAGERYEELRRVLIRFFEWRNAPFPYEHADETLNRVARKIDEGVEIKNISAYCHEVARYVFLEAVKGRDSKLTQLNDIDLESPVTITQDESADHERRLACLDICLDGLESANRSLIIEYYGNGERPLIDHRRAIAERLGLRRDALANRVQRLRDKLERCVRQCVRQR